MKTAANARATLVTLLCAAFVVRLAAGFWWQTRLPDDVRFQFADSESYWVLGQAIARGEPYQFGSDDARVFRTPGYPLALAGLFAVVGDDPHVMFARGLNALLGTLVVGGVYWLTLVLFNRNTAAWAAALAAFYPGAVVTSTFVLSEALFCPLMLLQLTLMARAWMSPQHVLPALISGMLAGAATLTRPSWLLFMPILFALTAVFSCQRRRACRIGIAALAGLVVVMLPWWMRNHSVTGRFVPTTLQVGASLYDGLNAAATGASDMQFAPHFRRLELAEQNQSHDQSDIFEYRLDHRLQRAAIVWARENPRQVLRLAAVKLMRMWSPWPNAEEFQHPALGLIMLTTYIPVVVIGIWSAVRFRRHGWAYLMCWLPAVYLTILHVIFASSIRYRQPAMLPLMVLAAGVVASWLGRGSPMKEDTIARNGAEGDCK